MPVAHVVNTGYFGEPDKANVTRLALVAAARRRRRGPRSRRCT